MLVDPALAPQAWPAVMTRPTTSTLTLSQGILLRCSDAAGSGATFWRTDDISLEGIGARTIPVNSCSEHRSARSDDYPRLRRGIRAHYSRTIVEGLSQMETAELESYGEAILNAQTHRAARLVTVGLPTLVLLAILASGCDSGAKPTSAGLVTSAWTYWTDLSLRTYGTLAAAYGYLSPDERDPLLRARMAKRRQQHEQVLRRPSIRIPK